MNSITSKKILLATDGSESAYAATDYLMGLPLAEDTQVTVLTVLKDVLHEDELAQLDPQHLSEYQTLRAAASKEAQQLLDTEAQRLRTCGLKVETQIGVGHPAEEIVRTASDGGYQMIVVGSHGYQDTTHFLLGGVSDRVFEYATCSVLIVKPASDQAVSDEHLRILLAYDDSPAARSAVQMIASLPLPASARLKAVTVLPLIKMFRQDVRQQLSWVWQEKKDKAHQGLDWVSSQVDWKGMGVETELLEAKDVAQALLDQAAAFDADLLIIGHKSKRMFERFLLGSVTAHVAHHAPCSVLAVREI